MISKKSHCSLDLLYGCVLFLSPYLFDMRQITNAKLVFFSAGLLTFANMFFPRLFHLFSTKLHMMVDLLIGIFLILGPTLFSYKSLLTSGQYEVHILGGFLFILLVGETRYRHETSIAGSKIVLDVGHLHWKNS